MALTKHAASRKPKRKRPYTVGASSPATTRAGTSSSPRRSGRHPPPSTEAGQRQPKRRHARPGTVALREVRQFHGSWKLPIPASPFIRTVKEISKFFAPEIGKQTAEALVAIQEG